jgi:hypothetical protein
MSLIEVNWNPSRKMCRQFGAVAFIVFGALGAWALIRHRLFGFGLSAEAARITGAALIVLAVACGALAIVAPRSLRWLSVALTLLVLPIGMVVSFVIVAALFYLLFTPVALFFRLIGRDLMHRRFEPSAETYWTRRKPVTDVKRYLRQS